MNLRNPKFSPLFPLSSRPLRLSPHLLVLAFSPSLSSLFSHAPSPHLFLLVICSPFAPSCSFSSFPLPPLLFLSFSSSPSFFLFFFPARFSLLFFSFSFFSSLAVRPSFRFSLPSSLHLLLSQLFYLSSFSLYLFPLFLSFFYVFLLLLSSLFP